MNIADFCLGIVVVLVFVVAVVIVGSGEFSVQPKRKFATMRGRVSLRNSFV